MLQKRKLLFVFFLILCLVGLGTALFTKQYTQERDSQMLTSPLAQRDPVVELEGLLREKSIKYAHRPVAIDGAIVFTLENGETQIFLNGSKDVVLSVDTLQIILNKLTIDGRRAKKIDLRFDDPIIVY